MTYGTNEQPAPVAAGAALRPGLLHSRRGRIRSFDVDVGVGEVESADGERYPFHCTAIAGGKRVIDEGVDVVFSLLAYHGGVLQAGDLVEVA